MRPGALPPDLIASLDAFQAARGLRSRSEAMRLLVAEVAAQPEPHPVADRDEILPTGERRARSGNVAAMRLLLDLYPH